MSVYNFSQITDELLNSAIAINAFKVVEQYKINTVDTADTELPKLMILLNNISFVNPTRRQINACMKETYSYQAMIVATAFDNKPMDTLYNLQTSFITGIKNSPILNNFLLNDDISFTSSTISNNVNVLGITGGISCILNFTISNLVQY